MSNQIAMFDVNVISEDDAQRFCEEASSWNETSADPRPSYKDRPTVVGIHPVFGRFGLTPAPTSRHAVLFTEDSYVFEMERGS